MQNEMMRGGQPAMGSENVGDVLASIRRLIAQDGGAGRLTTAPDLAAAFRHADLLNAREYRVEGNEIACGVIRDDPREGCFARSGTSPKNYGRHNAIFDNFP